jgi:hypothetical protein
MTFEEFLIKKKIDPVQLKNTEQALFSEFNSHFNEMGEKSFDHSKKFWFNKLRRANPLKEEPKPETITIETPINKTDLPENTSQSKEDQIKKEEVGGEITNPKPAFKPRFKANIIAASQEQHFDSVSSIPAVAVEKTEDSEKPKPAYKPRFKAAIPVAEEPKVENNNDEDIPEQIMQPKLAYKPRFKPAMIRKDPEQE